MKLLVFQAYKVHKMLQSTEQKNVRKYKSRRQEKHLQKIPTIAFVA